MYFLGSLAGGSRSSSATNNTAIGMNALRYIEGGGENTAVGASAMIYCDGNSLRNVVIGANAASGAFGTKSNNIAIGYRAMHSATNIQQNVVIGDNAGASLTTSPDNTFIGYQAGLNYNNTQGDGRNVLVGSGAGNDLTTGIYNTFLGFQAGGFNTNITTGNFNVMVGYQASGSGTTSSNQNSFGYASSCSGNNQVTLGNTSIGTLRCQVTSITAISDERDKTDIKTIPYGLDFINSLQPKQFVWNHRAEIDDNGNEFFSSNKGKKDIGFIAQDLQAVDDDYLNLVYDENPDKLEATYGRLIPVLVQAIKELKAEIELLKQ